VGVAQEVEIGGQRFGKKTDALKYFKTMLNSYALGAAISDSDLTFLRSAITRHPEAASKVGVGISHIEVRPADYGTRCFWIVRIDGTSERFSYKSCV